MGVTKVIVADPLLKGRDVPTSVAVGTAASGISLIGVVYCKFFNDIFCSDAFEIVIILKQVQIHMPQKTYLPLMHKPKFCLKQQELCP